MNGGASRPGTGTANGVGGNGEVTLSVPGTVPDSNPAPPPSANNRPPQVIFIVQQGPHAGAAPPGGGSLFDSMGRQPGPFSMAFPEKTTKWLALSLLIAGGLSILLKVLLLGYRGMCQAKARESETLRWNSCDTGVEVIGHGIWCGLFFAIAGAFGLMAAKKPTNCSLVTCMVLTIISTFLSLIHMIWDGAGVMDSRDGAKVATFVVLFLLGAGAGVASVMLSAYTCRAVCCSKLSTEGAVYFTANNVNEGGMNTDWARVAAAQALQSVHTTQPGANPSAPPAYDAVMTTAQPAKVDLSNID